MSSENPAPGQRLPVAGLSKIVQINMQFSCQQFGCLFTCRRCRASDGHTVYLSVLGPNPCCGKVNPNAILNLANYGIWDLRSWISWISEIFAHCPDLHCLSLLSSTWLGAFVGNCHSFGCQNRCSWDFCEFHSLSAIIHCISQFLLT